MEQKTIFFPPKWKKYGDIITFKTPGGAENAAKILMNEFNSAKTHGKRLRIFRAVQLAENRARATLNRKDLCEKERMEYGKIVNIYNELGREMSKNL